MEALGFEGDAWKGLFSKPIPVVFYSTNVDHTDRSSGLRQEASTNASQGSNQFEYFERKYSSGWFTQPVILNAQIEESQLYSVLSSRARTHFPKSISAYTTSTSPHPSVFFSILWVPNKDNIAWTVTYNQDGASLQDAINKLTSKGYKPSVFESYAFDGVGSILYAAVFLASSAWPSGTRFEAAFGVPDGALYCCGSGSRWTTMRKKGMKPVSISVVEDPKSRLLYVADTWNSASVGMWQGGLDKSAAQLEWVLKNLVSQLAPVFIKGYRRSIGNGKHTILFSYIAYKAPSSSSSITTVTTHASRSAFQLLAALIPQPPISFTTYSFDGAEDAAVPGSGEMYSAIWAGAFPPVSDM